MNINLVVVSAFAGYAKGDVITDAPDIARVLASEAAHNVVRVAVQEG